MSTRCLSMCIILSVATLYGCGLANNKSIESLHIADLDASADIILSKNSSVPSRAGSIGNFRAYLSDNENTLYRGEVLKRLAALELEESEIVSKQVEELGPAESEQHLKNSIEYYMSYLKMYPDKQDNDHVLYQLAKAYEFLGDTDNMLLVLNETVLRYPNSEYIDEIQFRRGEVLFVYNDYVNAEQAYAEIVYAKSSSQYLDKALYKLAWSQFKQGKYIESLKQCMTLLDRMQAKGMLTDISISENLALSERDFMNDVLRVMSLSLSYKDGTKTIQYLFADIKSRQYEPLLYLKLSELYLRTERTLDAADVYLDYVKIHQNTLLAAEFYMLALNVYKTAGLAELLLTEKVNFVKEFGAGTVFWESYAIDKKQKVSDEVKASIYDLANYYHAIALKTGLSKDYKTASLWYEEYIRSFPDDVSTPKMNFMLAESLYDSGHYTKALDEYLKTAYGYELHGKSAESGYAAIIAYKMLIEKANKQDITQLEVSALKNAIRFSYIFRNSKYAPSVIVTTAEKLYENKDYKGVIEFAGKNVHLKDMDDKSYFKTTWLLYAHSLFELQEYATAEEAYNTVRTLMIKSNRLYVDISERLSASIYMQAQTYRDLGYNKLAAYHFLRIEEHVPNSKIYDTAQFDAAAVLITLKNWSQATGILEKLRVKHIEDNSYSRGVSQKLVLTYTETGQFEKAADEAAYLSEKSENNEERRVYAWLSAESYQKASVDKKANKIYIKYIDRYPVPFSQYIEAHQRVINYFRDYNDPVHLKKWLSKTVAAEINGGNMRTDRTKFIASRSALELAGSLQDKFKKIELKEPLKKSLKTKKKLMKKALKAYSELMAYEIAEVTTSSTYHVADIYGHFAAALINSQRPKNLDEDALEQYNVLLEEQAYPFEEKAIEIHSANAKRTRAGVYDEWIKKSIQALSILNPIRYAKTERVESYVK